RLSDAVLADVSSGIQMHLGIGRHFLRQPRSQALRKEKAAELFALDGTAVPLHGDFGIGAAAGDDIELLRRALQVARKTQHLEQKGPPLAVGWIVLEFV